MRKIKGDALFFRVLIRKRCFIFYIPLLILSRIIVFKTYLQLLRLYFLFFLILSLLVGLCFVLGIPS